MVDAFSDDQRSAIDKIEKLLRLAGKNTNEAEASAATAKAMELLEAYNLDLGAIDASEDGSGKRAEEKLMGGFYEFERDLWARVADLNWCIYWNQLTYAPLLDYRKKAAKLREGNPEISNSDLRFAGVKFGNCRQHRLVGRTINIIATKAMAGYLLGAIERLTLDRLGERFQPREVNSQIRSRWAVSYREGIANRIAEKLWDRRQIQLNEEVRAAEEARRRAEKAQMAGASTETAITLTSLRKSEEEANMDFVYGEGWSAKQAARRAERARIAAEAEAAHTAWAAANPEEARKQEAEREAQERKRSAHYRGGSAGKERDWGAYRAGYDAGADIGLDPQTEGRKAPAGVLSNG